jgi:hypothetical protein
MQLAKSRWSAGGGVDRGALQACGHRSSPARGARLSLQNLHWTEHVCGIRTATVIVIVIVIVIVTVTVTASDGWRASGRKNA